jgi:hypothetical protein
MKTARSNCGLTFPANDFRITATNFPPAYPGSLVITTNNGYYDPVWPPGAGLTTPDRWVNLYWWYSWFPEPPDDPDDFWRPGDNATYDTYCHETGEHNGAHADTNYVYFVWSDNRNASQQTVYAARRQADIRLARLPWPQQ